MDSLVKSSESSQALNSFLEVSCKLPIDAGSRVGHTIFLEDLYGEILYFKDYVDFYVNGTPTLLDKKKVIDELYACDEL